MMWQNLICLFQNDRFDFKNFVVALFQELYKILILYKNQLKIIKLTFQLLATSHPIYFSLTLMLANLQLNNKERISRNNERNQNKTKKKRRIKGGNSLK